MTLTWREKIVCRILLILARMFADDPKVRDDIKSLTTTIYLAPTVPAEDQSA